MAFSICWRMLYGMFAMTCVLIDEIAEKFLLDLLS